MAIDPAQSFSTALNQGLGIMKSYRDEERLDEETAFNRSIALSQEDRAKNADRRAQQTQDMLKDTYDYEKGRRPKKEELEQAQLTGYQLDNDGKKKNNAWIDEINTENIRASKDGSARGWAGIDIQRGQLALQTRQQQIAEETANSQNAFRMLVDAAKTRDYSVFQNNPKVGTEILRLAGAAYGAPQLLDAMQNPTGAWLRDPKQKRAVLNVAAIDLGGTADKLGFRRGSVSVVDIKPSNVKGKLNIEFVGLNPRTGRLEKRTGPMDAARLFDKAAVFSNTLGRINDDPAAQNALVNAFRASQPENFGKLLTYEIKRRESAISAIDKDLAQVQDPEGTMRRLQLEVTNLENNDPTTIAGIMFPRVAKVGREFTTSHTSRAYDNVESLAPTVKGNPDAILRGINSQLAKAAANPKYYQSILKKGGIDSSGPFDPSKVLQALGG